ncbi:MAG: hypothetical protein EOO71_00830 [Myxococcaceae bacterium]|nr:MAG: hypothetical protein EOO71_00830 [Myxococcaceae bacterium]
MKRWSLYCLSLAAAVLGCGGSSEDGYEVRLEVVGPPEAFSGRTVEIQGVTAPAARARTGSPGQWTTEVIVCTRERAAFLGQALHVRILEGDQVRVDRLVERGACRDSATPAGDQEHDVAYLEADGTLVTDFGEDPRTEAVCHPPNAPIPCPQPRF